MTKLAPTSDQSLTQNAYNAVLHMIQSGALSNGEVVNERRLAEQLGLSRTPVREALGRLEGSDYLRRSGRTLLVNGVELSEILEIMAVRILLEADAARNAAGKMSAAKLADIRQRLMAMTSPDQVTASDHWEVDDFLHLSIAETSGNKLSLRLISELRARTRMFGKETVPTRFESGRDEHLAIIDAIEAGDGDRAAQLMVQHIEGARYGILQSFTASSLR
ncbi:DNA-binding GntR family transcriptional regulator [Erwinia toletana]|uniref:DNA-binding GntR family transcriptional regulator n=1 Tax=Winslowiella toletana TaxID=92490 RepID=A0ABS4PFC3_9GAMM|nr:GntR family transcriptional regulator [Winslowiella toletana]MBP2171346.1 DNA-binding GntR family transcriptional regulator [Winslowiella toletana]